MNRKWVWYLGFFVVLFAAFYIYISSTMDLTQSKLPIINNYIQPFSFVNQDNKKITEKDVEGKVYVTEYFFTTCKGICPKMNANMRRVFEEYKSEKDFMIVSHTCMPETDSVPLLKAYEQKMIHGQLQENEEGGYKITYNESALVNANLKNSMWHFVTGDKAALYKMARQSYLIDNNQKDTASKIDDQFIHTQFFALIDKQTRLRGIYDGLKEDEIKKLMKDIKGLLKEKYQTRSL